MKKLYFGLFLSLFVAITFGQNIAFEQVVPLPPAPQNIADFAFGSPVFADIDNDNDLDIINTQRDNYNPNELITKIYTNNGSGSFTESLDTPFEGIQCSYIAFADIDNDNDLDVVISGYSILVPAITKIYINDGTGDFAGVVNTPFGYVSGIITIADVNNDDFPDLVIGGSGLYSNDGAGNFTLFAGSPFNNEYDFIQFADIDNDDDLDVLIGGSGLYTNDGTGNFTLIAGSPLSATNGSINFADIDNDNYLDVLIGEYGLYKNDGAGNFTFVPGPLNNSSGSITMEDIDNDNDLDVLISGFSTQLYKNDGNGNFTKVPNILEWIVYYGYPVFVDIDNDDDRDLLITGLYYGWWYWTYISGVFINDGNGIFDWSTTTSPFDLIHTDIFYVADFDNDNDPDVLLTGGDDVQGGDDDQHVLKLYNNDGNGNYSRVRGSPFDEHLYSTFAIADVDNDNDQDVMITGGYRWYSNEFYYYEFSATLYANDENGNYTKVNDTTFDGVLDGSIAFADIDNDNDQDLFITGRREPGERIAKLYTNDGNGIFTEVTGTPFEGVDLSSIAFADIDNDNDQDLLITGDNGAYQSITKLYTNDGNGNFTELLNTPFYGINSGSIAFADIDNDNDLDLLITGKRPYYIYLTKLYTNDGSGNFSEVLNTPFVQVCLSSIEFADIDNDNDLDVLITGGNGYAPATAIAVLYSNDGNGNFTEITGTPFVGVMYSSVAFADIDNDSDLDVMITGKLGDNPDINDCIAKLYTNEGSGTFSEVSGTSFIGVYNGTIAFTDIDNDNNQDMIITGSNVAYGPIAKLYRNISSFTTKIPEGNTAFSNVSIYPNPSHGEVTIDLGELSNVSINLYSLSGQLIYQKENIMDSQFQLELTTETGIYILELSNQQEKQYYKLIKE